MVLSTGTTHALAVDHDGDRDVGYTLTRVSVVGRPYAEPVCCVSRQTNVTWPLLRMIPTWNGDSASPVIVPSTINSPGLLFA
jgi:hypothetical protein